MSQSWQQVLIHFDGWDTAEHTAVTELAPLLAQAEATGQVVSWFFVRKVPCWRLRFLPADTTTKAADVVHQWLDALRDAGRIARWVVTIYEPETHAFGGPQAMDTAHTLFHHDSRHILRHLATTAGGADKRRELAVLLCCAMMRGASLDWHEQGDVWARVAEHRSLPPDTPPDRLHTLRPGLRRLLTVDTTPLTQDTGPLAFLGDWQAGFTSAGTSLGAMAREGVLQRGLRAVLAQHVIFAWNRIGLPRTTQSLLAHVATAAVFDQ